MRRVLAFGMAAGCAWMALQPVARADEPRPIDYFFPRPAVRTERTPPRASARKVVRLEEEDEATLVAPRYKTVPYSRTYGAVRTTPTTWGYRYGVGYGYPAYGSYYGSGYYGAPMAYPMYGYSYGYNYGGAPYSAHCYSRGPYCDSCAPAPRSNCCLFGGLFGLFGGGCGCNSCCAPPPPVCGYDPCYGPGVVPGGVIMGPPPGTQIETQSPVGPPEYAPQNPVPPTPDDRVSPPSPIEKKGTAPSARRYPQLIVPNNRPSV